MGTPTGGVCGVWATAGSSTVDGTDGVYDSVPPEDWGNNITVNIKATVLNLHV